MASLEQETGDRLEQLSDEDLEAIKLVVDPKSAEEFVSGEPSAKLKAASKRVDKAIKTEKLNRGITIYKPLSGDVSGLKNGGTATLAAYLVGTIKKPDMPKGGGLLRVRIPKGTNALKFPGQAYLLEKGLTLDLSPSKDNEIGAKLVTGETEASSTGDIALVSPVQEFHQSGEHNQESHGNWAPDVATEGPGREITDQDKAIARRKGLTPEQVASIRKAGDDPEDYDASGKPEPGTRSWQKAHGIEQEVFDSRPMKRYKGPNDPAIEEMYGDLPPEQKRFAKKIAGQEDGIIMNRTPVPGAEEEFGKITPQIRPDKKILLDQRTLDKKERELQAAKDRVEQVNGWKPDDVVKERERKVAEAKRHLDEVKTSQPEDITERGRLRKEDAEANLNKVKKGGDSAKIEAAEADLRKAEYAFKNDKKTARELDVDPGRAVSRAEQELRIRENSLARAKADPEKTLRDVQAYSAAQVPRKQEQLEGVRVKYVFPKGEGTASRIEANPDAQNIKNLTQGNGRVYFVMEGNIKSDAVLSQVKKEDPTAAVISVPSVTAWPDGETDFVAKKYLKGRDVILIPDADGVKNPAVVQQAKKLRGKLVNNGVENVIMAAPPVEVTPRGGFKIEKLRFPTGVIDERKGVDDHLGLGKGTLGDLVFNDTPTPRLDVSSIYKQNRKNINSVPNANKTISAISDLAGDSGVGRLSHKSLEKYTGLAPSSVNDSIKGLEKTGVIKVHHIFDPKLLGHGRRVPVMEEGAIRKITKRAGVPLPDLTKTFVSDDDNHEVGAIIEIRNPSFITKTGGARTLASVYKGLRTSGAPKPTIEVSKPGIRIVRTPEGAKRYGVPIGQEIPVGEDVEAAAKPITMVTVPVQFHQLGTHDQLNHAPGGRNEGGGIDKKKVAIAVGATALAAGLLYVAYKKAPATVRQSEAARKSRNLEALVAKGGKDLDDAIADRTAKIAAGKNVERNTRDLSVLRDKTFVHQDDAAQFITNLQKNPYTPDEQKALWDYGGVFRDAEKGGDLTKGPFRFHRLLRSGQTLRGRDLKITNTVDRAIRKNGLPRETKLFRGVPATDKELAKWSRMKPGTRMKDPAYSFVGLTESRAKPHYWDDALPTSNKFKPGRTNPVLFRINAPKGLPAVPSPYGIGVRSGQAIPVPRRVKIGGRILKVPKADSLNIRAPFLSHANKEELVLRRNQEFVVRGVSTRDDGVLIVDVDAVV